MGEGARLAFKSLLSIVGVLLLLAGLLELALVVVAPEQDPNLLLGLMELAAGIVLAGIPIYLGFRDLVQAKRERARRGG